MRCPSARYCATFAGLLLAVWLGSPAPARADEWAGQEERCGPVLRAPAGAPSEALQACLVAWYQVRHLEEVGEQERQEIVAAASHLHRVGDRAQEHAAALVLSRLGVSPPDKPRPSSASPVVGAERAGREKYVAGEASAADKARARQHRKKGFQAYKKKRWSQAIQSFERAVAADPGYVQALYDLACTHALAGDGPAAVEYLRKLVDLGTEEAMAKIHKSRSDRDFVGLRRDQGFRVATGYARLKLVNGVGEYGEDEVAGFARLLRDLGHDVAETGVDKAQRRFPIIWYRAEDAASATVARFYRRVLGHPNTRYGPMDWDSDFDVIISWGDVIEFDDRGDPIVKEYAPSDPREADRKAADLRHEQDRALREPEGYARDVDHAVGTPERLQQQGEASIRRTERTIETLERTGDKVKDVFK